MKKIANKSSYKWFAEVMTKKIPLIKPDCAVRLTNDFYYRENEDNDNGTALAAAWMVQ